MTLNAEQQAAVDCTALRIACFAGAGSGKTRVLVARVLRLLDEGVYPGEIVCLTFTRKAGREMRARIEAAGVPGHVARKLVVSTFHSWAARLLREYAHVLGLDPLFTIRDDRDREDLIKWAGADLGLKAKTARTLWKDERVRERYAELLREARALDYDSLETELLRLLGTPQLDRLRERYRHVLVDEGQDTSGVQQRILDALNPAHIFVVGDPGQSIYAFRGARMEGFVEMAQRPGWERLTLATNYRSAASIVEAASRVAAAMTPQGLPQVPGREDADGTVDTVATLTQDGALDTVADMLAVALERGAEPGHLAVLSPTWAPLERLQAVLAARGLPGVVARKAAQVWESDEARWLVSVLRVAVNPHDTLALRHAVNAFRVRVPLWLWAQSRAAAAADGGTVESALYGEATGLAPGLALLDVATAIKAARDAVFVHDASQLAGVRLAAGHLEADLRSLHLGSRAERMGDVVDAVYAWGRPFFALGEQPSIADFLDWYATRELADTEEPDAADQPQLMTIHAAKGLEWERVWVLGCNEGDLPRRSGDVEEQRRLFYVATTRARDQLTWVVWGEPSRFILEAVGSPEVA